MAYIAENLTRLRLGTQGDETLPIIELDVSSLQERFPEATFDVVLRRPGETKAQAYPVTTSLDEHILTWTVHAADVEKAGYGMAQIVASRGENDHWYGPAITCQIRANIAGTAPTSTIPWVSQVLSAGDAAQQAAIDAENAAIEATGVVNVLTPRVEALETAMPQKASTSDVNAALALKANKTYVDTQDTALSGRITALENAGSGLTSAAKTALINCFRHCAWDDQNGQTYLNALINALSDPSRSLNITYSGTVATVEHLSGVTVTYNGTVATIQ